MSAPGIGRNTRITLPDFDRITHRFDQVGRLPKPIKALVYLVLAAVITVASLVALAIAVVVIGELTSSFDLGPLIGG